MVDQTRDRKPLFLAERRLFLPVDLGVQSPLSLRQVAQVDHAQDLDQALLAEGGVALANLLGVRQLVVECAQYVIRLFCASTDMGEWQRRDSHGFR